MSLFFELHNMQFIWYLTCITRHGRTAVLSCSPLYCMDCVDYYWVYNYYLVSIIIYNFSVLYMYYNDTWLFNRSKLAGWLSQLAGSNIKWLAQNKIKVICWTHIRNCIYHISLCLLSMFTFYFYESRWWKRIHLLCHNFVNSQT